MKHTGNAHASPGEPSRGKGGDEDQGAMFPMITRPINRNQRADSPRPRGADCGSGSWALTCSLDNLSPLHTQERGVLPRSRSPPVGQTDLNPSTRGTS
jgi:hypothetical protein